MSFEEGELGWVGYSSGSIVFFGKGGVSLDQVSGAYGLKSIHFAKQIHGKKIVSTNDLPIEADGIWTNLKNDGVAIQTADCVPVLLTNGSKFMALHVGWRGYVADIISSAATIFDGEGLPVESYIGPCILESHFEVGVDVAEKILELGQNDKRKYSSRHKDPAKLYVNLQGLVECRLKERV